MHVNFYKSKTQREKKNFYNPQQTCNCIKPHYKTHTTTPIEYIPKVINPKYYKKYANALKVRQSRNVFFKPTILPKNKQTNSFFFVQQYYDRIVSFIFLEEFEDSKKSFQN